MDAKQFEDLTVVMRNLCQVMGEETRAVSAGDFDGVARLFEEKKRLVRSYEQQYADVHGATWFPQELDEDDREELVQLGQELSALNADNTRVLRGMIDAASAVVDTIYRVHADDNRAPIYARNGRLAPGSTTALSFNQNC